MENTREKRSTLSIVTKKSQPTVQRDPSIIWQGRVCTLVNADCQFDDMGGECLVVPVGSKLEMHVTNTAAVPALHEERAVMVHGLLTIRRGMPYEVTSMTLQLDDLQPATLELCFGTRDDCIGSFWSKRVPGSRWMYIVPASVETEAKIAA